MSDLRKVAQQALMALEDACGNRCNAENNPCYQRIVAQVLLSALAIPEPEPVSVEMATFIHDLVCQAARVAATAEGEFNNQVYYAVFDHFTTDTDRNTNDFTPYEPTEIDEWKSYDEDC